MASAPSHGYITCSGPQVTDHNCTFTCERGYSIKGSSFHTCLPSGKWSGILPYCQIQQCPHVNVTDKTLVLYPCNNTYNGSCNVLCRHGFQVSGKAGIIKWRQTCEHIEDGSVAWRNSETCTGQYEGTYY